LRPAVLARGGGASTGHPRCGGAPHRDRSPRPHPRRRLLRPGPVPAAAAPARGARGPAARHAPAPGSAGRRSAPVAPAAPLRGAASPARALFPLLLRLHGVLVDQLPATRLRPGAQGDYPRWWHSLFSFVVSGPPPHRLHQLLALERAGVVRFLGPRVQVRAEESTGRFTARGAAGAHVTADALLDAFLPEASLVESTNPLLRDLVTGGSAA